MHTKILKRLIPALYLSVDLYQSISHYYTIPGPGLPNRMQPSLILSITPVLFQLWQTKVAAVKMDYSVIQYAVYIWQTFSKEKSFLKGPAHPHVFLVILVN